METNVCLISNSILVLAHNERLRSISRCNGCKLTLNSTQRTNIRIHMHILYEFH